MPEGATADMLVQISFSQTAQLPQPRGFRFLRHLVPGLPCTQLVIWGRLPHDETVVPFATQDPGRPVCTTRIPRESSCYEAALAVEAACGYGPFRHEALNRRQAHMTVNTHPRQPHRRWTFRDADSASFQIGPILVPPTQPTGARPTPNAPTRLPTWRRADITDAEPSNLLHVHQLDRSSFQLEIPRALRPSQILRYILGESASAFHLCLPPVMPSESGTPLHCLLLSTSHARTTFAATLDVRRVLCPPTAPFITIQISPITSYPAVLQSIGSIVPRHRPITAAYLNDEMLGTYNSFSGPYSTITLLSHRQTCSAAAAASVGVLDPQSEVDERAGFLGHAHFYHLHYYHCHCSKAVCPGA